MANLKNHPIFTDEEGNAVGGYGSNNALTEKARQYIKRKLTPAEYVELLSGQYGHDSSDLDRLGRGEAIIQKHPHNTERNNMAAAEAVLENSQLSTSQKEDLLSHIHTNFPLPKSYIASSIHEYPDPEHWVSQPNLDKHHLKQILDASSPERISEHFTELAKHPEFDKDLAKLALSKPELAQRLSSGSVRALLNSRKHNDPNKRLIDDSDIKPLLENLERQKHMKGTANPSNLLLNELPPEDRKKHLDKVLGIEGGKIEHEGLDPESDEHNYQNWDTGPDYNYKMARNYLEHSPHLTEDQIEHVKRHGDFQEKYRLFNNRHVDPKHANEMYKHWLMDHSDKGYDLDEFRDQIKEDNPWHDHYDSYYDAASEAVQEDYPFTKWVSDNLSDEDLMGESEENFIDTHLENNHDWMHTPKPTKDNPEPEEMDYSGRDKEDHPEYQQRYEEAQQAWERELDKAQRNPSESPGFSDRWYDSYDESLSDDRSQKARDLYDEDADTFHEQEDKLPNHLQGKLTHIEEIKRIQALEAEAEARKEAVAKEKKANEFLSGVVPNRRNEHQYGAQQHLHELVKDYADANGGSVGIDHLNKLYPNMKDSWKSIFGGKGKISSNELQQKIDALPKTKYNISYGKWDANQMQNLNGQDETIIRLDHSPESLEPLKQDEKVHNVFRKLQDVSQRSGHPTNFNTIAWARVDTSNPKHWMVDELQSDFGSAARDYLKEHGKNEDAEALDTVIKHHKNWREALLNHVIKTAKENGVEQISTHSPESKAAHTGSDRVHSVYKESYQKVPRAMGFKPSPMETLPLSDEGRNTFRTARSGTPTETLLRMHKDAMNQHANQWFMHNDLSNDPVEDRFVDAHKQLAAHHADLYKKHQKRLSELDPSSNFRGLKSPQSYHDFAGQLDVEDRNQAVHKAKAVTDHKDSMPVYGFDSALKEQPLSEQAHQGHTLDLRPETMKKSITEVEDLIKSELSPEAKEKVTQTLLMMRDKKDVLEQIKQSSPESYNAIVSLTQSLIDLYRKQTGEDPEDKAQQSEVEEHLDAHQHPAAHPGHLASKPEPIRNRKRVYAPGSVRTYGPGNAKEKTPEGKWVSVAGGVKNQEEQS